MIDRREETEEQWRLQVAKAEAWEDGYDAALNDLTSKGYGETRLNPFVIGTDE